jgi:pimeloyl-ACP methyl ester carboxylesterase
MTILQVPGATIYYEMRGSGPLLVMIPGGNGDAGPLAPVAQALGDRFTVVAYDRRGFSRSPMDEGVDPAEGRLEADVEDVVALIDALVGVDAKAHVFGSSSGAIVALHLLATHPDRVATLVAHEPPLIGLLPDADTWRAFFAEVHATYRRDGQDAASAQFAAGTGSAQANLPDPAQLPPHVREMLERMRVNQRFFFEHELRQYPPRTPDLDAIAARGAVPLVLAGGRESTEFVASRPNRAIASRLGLDVVEFPGDHIGYVMRPAEFAPALAQVLNGSSSHG